MPVAIAPEVTSTITSRPLGARAGDVGGQRRDPAPVGPGARRGDQAAADLHDEPADAA